ncbi:hypothetical protein [Parahaliea mediterranea]|uniref:hypothetical protein n=1 Tax=Parahaliea mediterranea TaxID=651086 RepID=UPI000E2FDAFB|nr:hypothetical protein [Parahaliea mediterranea]
MSEVILITEYITDTNSAQPRRRVATLNGEPVVVGYGNIEGDSWVIGWRLDSSRSWQEVLAGVAREFVKLKIDNLVGSVLYENEDEAQDIIDNFSERSVFERISEHDLSATASEKVVSDFVRSFHQHGYTKPIMMVIGDRDIQVELILDRLTEQYTSATIMAPSTQLRNFSDLLSSSHENHKLSESRKLTESLLKGLCSENNLGEQVYG